MLSVAMSAWTMATAIPGRARGSVIDVKRRHWFAPSTTAAS
jgi:hypothetical protein